MAKEARPKIDPRLRPFRAGAYGLYLLVVVSFSLMIINSVVRSVLQMTPAHRPDSELTWTAAQCADRASALFDALDAQRRGFVETAPVREVDRAWTDFRLGWLSQVREAESHCALEQREPVADVFRRLEGLMNLYTTHAVQFAGEIGGSVDRFRTALATARR